uniref:Elongation factor 1-delta n=1 Tax=Piliocolobus tephrosceles TaxID=591936 RepID=A0A8C9GJD1_9PRIM
MATNFLVHEKIWFDKFKYDDAERRFYEQMNGPVAGASRQTSGPAERAGEELSWPPGHGPADPATMRRRTRRRHSCGRSGCGSTRRGRPRSLHWWPSPLSCWMSSLGTMRQTWPSWRPVCALSSWTGWSGGPPSWCPWATVSGSCRFSVWWRTTRWGRTCWRRRSPSLRSTCRVSISQLSTRSEA